MKALVLIFLGNYLPGHKAGGIIRAITNTVDHLAEEFDFRIVTSDRDLGDPEPYQGIPMRTWVPVGSAQVYYCDPGHHSMTHLAALINGLPVRAIYLNSFFDPFTVKVLLARWLGRIPPIRLIVAPRGEFAWASLSQKYLKKWAFMRAARLAGLYGPAWFHASSPFEADDIARVMGIARERILVAFDFAVKAPAVVASPPARLKGDDRLRIVFLSRIAREKNLDAALRMVQRVSHPVVFDIFGPTADQAYWQECQAIMAEMPAHVEVRYRGIVEAGGVLKVFGDYDVFLFPSGGEAYGHVIVEALLAGTSVVTSRESAWRDLAADGLGWDLDLARPDTFVERLDALAVMSVTERDARRTVVRAAVEQRLADPAIADANRRLFVDPAS